MRETGRCGKAAFSFRAHVQNELKDSITLRVKKIREGEGVD